MRRNHLLPVASILALLLPALVCRAADAPSAGPAIDFRYRPTWWQTSICLPDDWQKTLVGKEGTLLYDFPGKHSGFKTRIGASVDGDVWVRQELASPRTPIVRTVKRAGTVEIVEEAFAVAPPIEISQPAQAAAFERLDRGNGNTGWAKPNKPCDAAFNDIAVGWNESVRYRVRVGKEKYTVAFGLCEGWHAEPGKRTLDLKIEGKPRKTVDMVAEHGRNMPAVFAFEAVDENGDGWLEIESAAAAKSIDQNAILNALWVYRGAAPATVGGLPNPAGAAGTASQLVVFVPCGHEPPRMGPPRHDVVAIEYRNTGTAVATVVPQLTIDSEMPPVANADGKTVAIGEGTTLFSPRAFSVAAQSPARMVLKFEPLKLDPGQKARFSFGVARGVFKPEIAQLRPQSDDQAATLRAAAADYWSKVDLPYGQIEVPDAGVQALLDSSIRNIYQAREIKKGLPAFQVGPTCYRGLWVVDGSFLMESVAYLGRVDEARNGIRYLLSFQRDDGAIMIMNGHWKETGIALWAVTRHARLTGDKAWLMEVWPKLERGWAYIGQMRAETLKDPKALNAGLIPVGFADGGLGGTHAEFTNIYWTLAGMKSAVDAARWLGKDQQAQAWQKEYDDFYATFRRAAERDARQDSCGNRFVPIVMGKDDKHSPQKAQWAFLHAVFPGKVFDRDDELVRGNMAMLGAVECEGLIRDTGWVERGVWNYFGSFYAHGRLWLGDGQKAAQTLYDFGNHASPLLCWREEQMPQGEGEANCGDMPHNWASAEFIRLVRHLLVLERGNELHLFEGLPAAWIRPGAAVRVQGVLTEFGPISIELRVAADGRTARLTLDPPRRDPPKKIVVHLAGWTAGQGTIELLAGEKAVREIPLR